MKNIVTFIFFLFFSLTVSANTASANDVVINDVASSNSYAKQTLQSADKGNLSQAKTEFKQYKTKWRVIEDGVKNYSRKAYKDIESAMGLVSYAFLQSNQPSLVNALNKLISVNQLFINGQYKQAVSPEMEAINLSDFIALLKQTKESVKQKNKQASLDNINHVRESWISVEGIIITQSASIYNHAERDMVVINAMIQKNNFEDAIKLLENMVIYLQPLENKTAYTFWDAAIILLREGLEALLVIGALLAFTNKSHEKKASRWVGYGVITGVIMSIALAVLVKLVFSSAAFGTNNFLISGWSGIFAAIMLLYMSYWLHSKSNISEWNQYIANMSSGAIASGRLVSLAFLSFLAIFREGTEIVLFIIGIINQISLPDLILGLLIGSAFLSVLAFLMLFVGVKLPIRPFFMVSSFVMLYLCIKFTGMGVHSLQMAGVLSSTPFSTLPSLSIIGFYPSIQSAAPQLLIVVFALLIVLWRYTKTRNQNQKTQTF